MAIRVNNLNVSSKRYFLVDFFCREFYNVEKVGNTSLTIHVETYAQRCEPLGLIEKISDATLIYVAISGPGVKRPIRT